MASHRSRSSLANLGTVTVDLSGSTFSMMKEAGRGWTGMPVGLEARATAMFSELGIGYLLALEV